jgi:hypothetical protein
VAFSDSDLGFQLSTRQPHWHETNILQWVKINEFDLPAQLTVKFFFIHRYCSPVWTRFDFTLHVRLRRKIWKNMSFWQS